MFQAFRELKAAFDPKNLLNPGNIVASPGVTQHMRYGTAYKTWEPKTLLDFSVQGGFAAAVEMCNGVGECRKKLEGTMCPSYMATKDEEHSTRGRANALRAVLSGKVPAADFAGKRLYEVMDLCLECKGCKSECPSNVDMAKMKYEFLHHYHQVNGLPLRNRLFGNIAKLSRLGSGLAPISNWIASSLPNRLLMEKLFGIDRRRPLPAFAGETFTAWFDRRKPVRDAPRGPVALFADTFVTYNTPEVGRAAVELLEAAGYAVQLPDKKCCGRPMISKGMLAEAKALAEWNVARLAPLVARGIPIVGLEPSCLLTLRDEWVELVRSDEARAGRPVELPPRGVPAPRAEPRAVDAVEERYAPAACAAARALPPEGDGRHGPDGGRAPVGGLRGERGGLRLLRHGGLVRLRKGALRHLGQLGKPAARARGQGASCRHRGRRSGYLVPPADSAPGRTSRQAPRRSAEGVAGLKHAGLNHGRRFMPLTVETLERSHTPRRESAQG